MATEAAVVSKRARGRWKILRQALLQAGGDTARNDASIHSFPGYQMLTSSVVHKRLSASDLLNANIAQNVSSLEDLRNSVRVLIALHDTTTGGKHQEGPIIVDLPIPSLQQQNQVQIGDHLQELGCEVVSLDVSQGILSIRLPTHQGSPQYCIKEYQLPTADPSFLYIHEKRQRTVSSLHDLVRHRESGIDNTGDVCVWDAALTLAWALVSDYNSQQQKQEEQPNNPTKASVTTILELGSGMAAMAGLSLARQMDTEKAPFRLYITDGQASAVANNRIHCRCMGLKEPFVQCRVLMWSHTPIGEASLQANCTLIADCTHFSHYHAHLLWTAVYHTAVDGKIWMCQPARSKSWQQFLDLVKTVNSDADAPLLHVQEKRYTELDQKHEEFSKTSTTTYIPHLHRPLIFLLTKLRVEEDSDRRRAVDHVKERDAVQAISS